MNQRSPYRDRLPKLLSGNCCLLIAQLIVLVGMPITGARVHAQNTIVVTRLRPTDAQIVYKGDDGVVGLASNVPLAVNSNGVMFVLDGAAGAVYRISLGQKAIRIGGKGWGPGEYLEPVAIGWLHDTLWVSDKRALRVTLVPAWGAGPATTIAVSMVGTSEYLQTVPYALTPSGHAIVAGMTGRSRMLGTPTQSVPVWRTARSGTPILDTISYVSIRNGELIVRVRGSKAYYTVTQPLSDATLWNVSRNGAYYVDVVHQRTGSIGASRPMLTLKKTDGRQIFRIPLPGAQVALTDREYAAVVAKLVERLNAEGRRLGFGLVDEAALKNDMFRPRMRAMATQILVADNGSVLIRGPDYEQKDVEYTLVRVNGDVAGTFRVPFTQRIRAMVGDYVWSYVERPNGEIDIVRERLAAERVK